MLASTLGEDVKAHLPPHTRGVLSHTVPKERVGVGVTSTVHRERKVTGWMVGERKGAAHRERSFKTTLVGGDVVAMAMCVCARDPICQWARANARKPPARTHTHRGHTSVPNWPGRG
jgi:hypothetical protein